MVSQERRLTIGRFVFMFLSAGLAAVSRHIENDFVGMLLLASALVFAMGLGALLQPPPRRTSDG